MQILRAFILAGCLLLFLSLQAQQEQVLVFHKTDGFVHESVAAGYQKIISLGESNGFEVRQTNNSEVFMEEDFHKYDLVIFLNTTGDVMNKEQQENFEKYINAGGSYFGIHSAADTEYDWEWYGLLVGAYFKDHPQVQPATIEVVMPNHPTVTHLPALWERTDEWYNYNMVRPDITILLNLREDSYKGGTMGEKHPLAWFRELKGGGISIYTGGGHTKSSYQEPLFAEHLLQCILYALNRENKRK